MKGANADPSVKTIMAPSNTRNKTIGSSHHFFRCFKKNQNSEIIDSFDISKKPFVIVS